MDGDRAISFHDLIELFVAGHLRDRGVSLQTLRKLHQELQSTLGTRHPFCRRELLTSGAEVFTIGLDEPDAAKMIDVLSRQRVFPVVLLPFLEQIEYDEVTKMARRWLIADQVVIDPAIGLGKPIIDGIGIATAVLAASYQANDQDAELVADWFRVRPQHVIAAVDFERSLAA